MKTIRLLGLTMMMVMLAGLVSSCNKEDDDESKEPGNSIVGTGDDSGSGGSSSSSFSSSDFVGAWILTYAEGKKYGEYNTFSFSNNVRLTILNSGYYVEEAYNSSKRKWVPAGELDMDLFNDNGTWEIRGNTLYMTDSYHNKTEQLTIEQLTSSSMTLYEDWIHGGYNDWFRYKFKK
jgi:hypothetical protein